MHDPSRESGFRVNTAYPLNEDLKTRKSIILPKAYLDLRRRTKRGEEHVRQVHRRAKSLLSLCRRLFQDADFFDTMDDPVRFYLKGIPRDQLGDFIAFAKRAERGEFTDEQLEDLWNHSRADYFIVGKNAVRRFLGRARDMAEREGPSGKLYRTPTKMNEEPGLKFEF